MGLLQVLWVGISEEVYGGMGDGLRRRRDDDDEDDKEGGGGSIVTGDVMWCMVVVLIPQKGTLCFWKK